MMPAAGDLMRVPSLAAISRPLWGLRGWSFSIRLKPKELDTMPSVGKSKSVSGLLTGLKWLNAVSISARSRVIRAIS